MAFAAEFGPPPSLARVDDFNEAHLDHYAVLPEMETISVRYSLMPRGLPDDVRYPLGDIASRMHDAVLAAWFPPANAALLSRSTQDNIAALEALIDATATAGAAADAFFSNQEMRSLLLNGNVWRRRGLPGTSPFSEESEQKARNLLLRLFSVEQRTMFNEHGWFEAVGHKTGARYRVLSKRQINIKDLTNHRKLCYVCPEVPICDQMAAQKLLIEGDEQHLLDVAIVWEEYGLSPMEGLNRTLEELQREQYAAFTGDLVGTGREQPLGIMTGLTPPAHPQCRSAVSFEPVYTPRPSSRSARRCRRCASGPGLCSVHRPAACESEETS